MPTFFFVGELLVGRDGRAAGERPRAQLGVAVGGAVVDHEVAARHEAALRERERVDVGARSASGVRS